MHRDEICRNKECVSALTPREEMFASPVVRNATPSPRGQGKLTRKGKERTVKATNTSRRTLGFSPDICTMASPSFCLGSYASQHGGVSASLIGDVSAKVLD